MGCFMSKKIEILVLLGSASKKSVNAELIKQVQKFPINTASNIQLVIMSLDKLPIFNEDEQVKENLNEEILNLRKRTEEARVIIFVSPEINGCISPLILNAFAWLSRSYDKRKGSPLTSKKAGIISASYLSQDQITDCLDIGKQFDMKFFQHFYLPLGSKPINSQGKIIRTQVDRLYDWYKKFVGFIFGKQNK